LANTTKPHICFVAPNIYPVLSGDYSNQIVGGAEVQQAGIARALAEMGYPVSVICLDFGQDTLVKIDGIAVHKTFRPGAGLPVIRFLYPKLTSIWARLKEVNADVYYVRTASMLTGVVAKFARGYDKKSIFAGADNRDFLVGESRIKFWRDRIMHEWGIRNVDKIVAQNRVQVDTCYSNYHRVAAEIANSFVPPQRSANRRREKILWVSTIRELKRPDRLIRLAKLLPHREFVMVGGGDRFEASLFDRIKAKADVEPNIKVVGFVPLSDVDNYFDEARILVNTSDSEGFPNTFLQAWSRAIPTVSLIDCGISGSNNDVGYRVDSVQQMAEISENLFVDENEYHRMGKICKKYCFDHHSIDVVISKYEDLIAQLILSDPSI
jgi:glycosyltransferase involved in cell wall biosynthesis